MNSHYHYETMAYSKKRFDTIESFLHSAHKYSSKEGEMSIVECWKYHITQWMSMANVHFISMDKMLRDFDNEMWLLKNFLEVPTIGKLYLKPKKLPYNLVSQLLIKTISRVFDLNYGVTGIVGRDKARKDIFTKNDLQYITDITRDTLELLGTD